MENNKEKKAITIKQGTGDDAIDMTIQVTQEELETMEQIRRFSPENWEGKDLELLHEARKIIKEKPVVPPTPQPQIQKNTTTEIEAEPKHNNAGLWWTLGLLAAVFIAYQIFNYTVNKRTQEVIVPYVLNKRTETLKYKGLTLNHPGNWFFTQNEVAEGMYMVGGRDQSDSEFGVIWTENGDMSVETSIDNIITGYAHSSKFNNVEYSAIYNTTFNGKAAKAADYSYINDGKSFFAKVIGLVIDGKTVIINQIAHTKATLSSDDFKMMENSISFSTSY